MSFSADTTSKVFDLHMMKIINVFHDMKASGHVFHLTGSRFFKASVVSYCKINSDWDFFVKDDILDSADSPAICLRLALERWGFHKTKLSVHYLDSCTIEVWKHTLPIHIQIIDSNKIKSKIKAQTILSNPIYSALLYSLEKPKRGFLWDLVVESFKWKGESND